MRKIKLTHLLAVAFPFLVGCNEKPEAEEKPEVEEPISFNDADKYYYDMYDTMGNSRRADNSKKTTINKATGFFEEYFNNFKSLESKSENILYTREPNAFAVDYVDAHYCFKNEENSTYTILNGIVTAEHSSHDCFEVLDTLLHYDGYRENGYAKKQRKLSKFEYDVKGDFYIKLKLDKEGFKDELIMRWNFSVTHLEGTGEDINGDVDVEYNITYTNKGKVEGTIII